MTDYDYDYDYDYLLFTIYYYYYYCSNNAERALRLHGHPRAFPALIGNPLSSPPRSSSSLSSSSEASPLPYPPQALLRERASRQLPAHPAT